MSPPPPRRALRPPRAGRFYPYFLSTLGRSSFLVDWLVLHEGIREPPARPENAKFIDLGRGGMAQLVASTIGAHMGWGERNVSRANKYLRFVMYKWPRTIAEYKPAFGVIFAAYLSNYTHWAFSDLDTQFGALPSFVELAELRDFDLVSYSFGDHDGLYLRGQWTMHRNAAEVNRVWTSCAHLGTELIRELATKVKWIKVHESKLSANGTHRQNYRKRFISAEGCYSTAAFDPARGMRIKIAHKQFVGLSTKSCARARRAPSSARRAPPHPHAGARRAARPRRSWPAARPGKSLRTARAAASHTRVRPRVPLPAGATTSSS